MSTIRQHLAKVHTNAAAFHVAMAKLHKGAMSKADGMEDEDGKQFHQGAMKAHAQAAEDNVQACDECQKAQRDDDIAKAVNTGVSGVTPDNPMLPRAVPREGQRPMSEANATPPVPLMFEKLIATEENELD